MGNWVQRVAIQGEHRLSRGIQGEDTGELCPIPGLFCAGPMGDGLGFSMGAWLRGLLEFWGSGVRAFLRGYENKQVLNRQPGALATSSHEP